LFKRPLLEKSLLEILLELLKVEFVVHSQLLTNQIQGTNTLKDLKKER